MPQVCHVLHAPTAAAIDPTISRHCCLAFSTPQHDPATTARGRLARALAAHAVAEHVARGTGTPCGDDAPALQGGHEPVTSLRKICPVTGLTKDDNSLTF